MKYLMYLQGDSTYERQQAAGKTQHKAGKPHKADTSNAGEARSEVSCARLTHRSIKIQMSPRECEAPPFCPSGIEELQ